MAHICFEEQVLRVANWRHAQRTQQVASLEGAVGVHGGTSTAESGDETNLLPY